MIRISLIVVSLALLAFGFIPQHTAAQEPCGSLVTVVEGDTIPSIAARCNTTVNALLRLNPDLDPSAGVEAGQVLRIPIPESQQGLTEYTVQRGDWLSSIARRFDTTISAIMEANPQIRNPNLIYPGQRLLIPGQTDDLPRQPVITISPTSGPPGTEVRVVAAGLPASTEVNVGIGRWRSEYEVVEQTETGSNGDLRTRISIPEYADLNERWVVSVATIEGDWIRETSGIFAVTGEETEAPIFEAVQIYLIAPGEGQLGCGDRVVPVRRSIAPTRAPLTAALNQLLSMNERIHEQSGLHNALYRSALEIEEIAIDNGSATVHLSGVLSIGGVCDRPRLQAQLEETILQFENISRTEIFVNGQGLEQLLSEP